MNNTDKRVDAYIEKSADFAKPILNYLRQLVHEACPEIQETIKWNFPVFGYKGKILCNMASFKQHCSFGFWLGSKMKDPYKVLAVSEDREGMGSLGKITTISDLPAQHILNEYIWEAMALTDAGVTMAKKAPAENKGLEIPAYFSSALKKNKAALKTFENFSYSNRKEYVDWVTEAKTEATRNKRLKDAVEWMSEGKIRNWKYLKK